MRGKRTEGRGCTHFMHSRSRKATDPRIPITPGGNKSGFQRRPGGGRRGGGTRGGREGGGSGAGEGQRGTAGGGVSTRGLGRLREGVRTKSCSRVGACRFFYCGSLYRTR